MTKEELNNLLNLAKEASLIAGAEILEIYNSDDFDVELKGDNSPLTKADKAAHLKIVAKLDQTGIPVLSEEGRDIAFNDRKDWDYLWVVDPLDGTKEFIKRNGEFTVNIALVQKGEPILGVVYAPILDKLYFGGPGIETSLTQGTSTKALPRRNKVDRSEKGIRIVASRSHLNDDTRAFLDSLEAPEIVSMGSSLKFMMLAEGLADIYPRFAPTMEWDTAAAHAVLRGVGGDVINPEGESLQYNKENLLNPYFSAE